MNNFLNRLKNFIRDCKQSPKKAVIAALALVAAVVVTIVLVASLATVIKTIFAFLAGVSVLLLIFTDFWEILYDRLRTPEQSTVLFPVYLGFEGGRIIPHLADQIFGSLYGRFDTCYFSNWCEAANHLTYAFKCVLRPDMPLDYNLIQLLQKQTEGILSRELSENGIVGANCQNLVAVDIVHDTMYITFAKNTQGIQEVINLQNRVRQKYLDDTGTPRDGISDKWEN